ncbi:MAG TPA: hypothetical protein VE172_12010 [Stackebrandtia sp.]|jgi:hypothetical protein|uniref:hypothetical protein n=1 Tax=Stackebrandtia sp. TaxID=2023065 RepID=UPI002D3F8B09|nr:hypothetical protein [Stackebrandtia sp.]HZE39524.1 hypothetical protein [Stackebrandtia sp.]
MSIAEVKAQTQQAIEQSNECISFIESAKTAIDNAVSAIQEASQDTSHDKPREAMSFWEDVRSKLDEAVQSSMAGSSAAEDYINSI